MASSNDGKSRAGCGAIDDSVACRSLLRKSFRQLSKRVENCDLDCIEEVHQTRVKLRAAKVVLDVVFADSQLPEIGRAKKSVRWLRRYFGRLRDIDVLVVQVIAWVEELPKPELAALLYRLASRRNQLQSKLLKQSMRTKFQQRVATLRRWDKWNTEPAMATEPDSLKLKVEYAIRIRADEVEARMKGDIRQSQNVHEIRKACKDLRYLSELVPATENNLSTLSSSLKTAQELLGALHDSMVLVEVLHPQRLLGKFLPEQTSEKLIKLESERIESQLGEFRRFWDAGAILVRLREVQ